MWDPSGQQSSFLASLNDLRDLSISDILIYLGYRCVSIKGIKSTIVQKREGIVGWLIIHTSVNSTWSINKRLRTLKINFAIIWQPTCDLCLSWIEGSIIASSAIIDIWRINIIPWRIHWDKWVEATSCCNQGETIYCHLWTDTYSTTSS